MESFIYRKFILPIVKWGIWHMNREALETAKKFLAEHYAAKLTADGKPTQAADVARFAQCIAEQSNYAKIQLETAVMHLYCGFDEKVFFKRLEGFSREGVLKSRGRLENSLYVLSDWEPPYPVRKI